MRAARVRRSRARVVRCATARGSELRRLGRQASSHPRRLAGVEREHHVTRLERRGADGVDPRVTEPGRPAGVDARELRGSTSLGRTRLQLQPADREPGAKRDHGGDGGRRRRRVRDRDVGEHASQAREALREIAGAKVVLGCASCEIRLRLGGVGGRVVRCGGIDVGRLTTATGVRERRGESRAQPGAHPTCRERRPRRRGQLDRETIELHSAIEGERAVGALRRGLGEVARRRAIARTEEMIDERVDVGVGLAEQRVGQRAMTAPALIARRTRRARPRARGCGTARRRARQPPRSRAGAAGARGASRGAGSARPGPPRRG